MGLWKTLVVKHPCPLHAPGEEERKSASDTVATALPRHPA
jgi:hypothetical protein